MTNCAGLPTVTLSKLYRSPLHQQSGAAQDGKGRGHYLRKSDYLFITLNHHKIIGVRRHNNQQCLCALSRKIQGPDDAFPDNSVGQLLMLCTPERMTAYPGSVPISNRPTCILFTRPAISTPLSIRRGVDVSCCNSTDWMRRGGGSVLYDQSTRRFPTWTSRKFIAIRRFRPGSFRQPLYR